MSEFFRGWSINQQAQWLRQDGKTRLFTLHLKHVNNPLNADALWDLRTGGDNNITTHTGDPANRRLLQALRAHCYTTTAYRDQAPQALDFVFSDVVVWIPAAIWRDADIENGEALFLMAERFRYQHELAFGEEMRFQNRPPNYCIMPLATLAEDEVICQFGFGVFLPNKDDVQTASLQVAKQGYAPESLPEWVFFERDEPHNAVQGFQQIHKVTRPAGLYAAQTMLLLAHESRYGAILSPLWPTQSASGEIIVNLNAQKPTAYGDETYITNTPPQRRGEQTSCYFHHPDNEQDGITLFIERLTSNAVMDALRHSASSASTGTVIDDDNDTLGGLSQIDFDDDRPDYIYQLYLTGIVLPRLTQLKNASALAYWQLALDSQGLPVDNEADTHWYLRGNRDESHALQWQEKGAETWQELEHDKPLPYPTTQVLHLEPAALAEKQFAILPLGSSTLSIPLGTSAIMLGRDIGDNSPAQVKLGFLQQASQLVYTDGSTRGSLDSIGLSAEHLYLQLAGRKLQLQQLKSQSYILQKTGEIRSHLTTKQARAELLPGESLLIGPFRFQFVEEFLPDRQD